MSVDCRDIQVFVSQQAWDFKRKKENAIRFVIRHVGWFDLELEKGTDLGNGS